MCTTTSYYSNCTFQKEEYMCHNCCTKKIQNTCVFCLKTSSSLNTGSSLGHLTLTACKTLERLDDQDYTGHSLFEENKSLQQLQTTPLFWDASAYLRSLNIEVGKHWLISLMQCVGLCCESPFFFRICRQNNVLCTGNTLFAACCTSLTLLLYIVRIHQKKIDIFEMTHLSWQILIYL